MDKKTIFTKDFQSLLLCIVFLANRTVSGSQNNNVISTTRGFNVLLLLLATCTLLTSKISVNTGERKKQKGKRTRPFLKCLIHDKKQNKAKQSKRSNSYFPFSSRCLRTCLNILRFEKEVIQLLLFQFQRFPCKYCNSWVRIMNEQHRLLTF